MRESPGMRGVSQSLRMVEGALVAASVGEGVTTIDLDSASGKARMQ